MSWACSCPVDRRAAARRWVSRSILRCNNPSMAVYIQLNKVEEDAALAVYEFGPIVRIVGQVLVDKSDGNVELWRIDDEYAAHEKFYLPRIRLVFARHAKENSYPDNTSYRA